MPKRKPYSEITAHAAALAELCIKEEISHFEMNVGETSAVIWRRFDVPLMRENETLIIGKKTERF